MKHWAYVEWSVNGFRDHEVTVTADHAHKACAKKSEDTDVTVECDVILSLPDMMRHCVSADSKDSALSAARVWALTFTEFGSDYVIAYIGAVEE